MNRWEQAPLESGGNRWEQAPLVSEDAASPPIWENINENPIGGIVEALTSGATGFISAAPAAIGGVIDAARGALVDAPGVDRGQRYVDTFRHIQNTGTYEPTTRAGKAIVGAIGDVMGAYSGGVDQVVESAESGTMPGSREGGEPPSVLAGIKTIGEALPLILGIRKGGAARAATPGSEAAARIGYQPRLSELQGKKGLISSVEDTAAQIPGGTAVTNIFERKNTRAINRAAASSIGVKSDTLTPKVLAEARDRIGKPFNDVAALPGHPIRIDRTVGALAKKILNSEMSVSPSVRNSDVIAAAKEARSAANLSSRISGGSYNKIRSRLSERAFDIGGEPGMQLRRLVDALDDSAHRSLADAGKTDLANALQKSREQYGNLMILERGKTVADKNVNPKLVASALRSKNPAAYREGRLAGTPLGDIAQVGEAFSPTKEGSQTFGRAALTGGIGGSLLSPSWWTAAATGGGLAGLASALTHSRGLRRAISAPANVTSRLGLLAPGVEEP